MKGDTELMGGVPQSPLLGKTLKVHTQSAVKYLYPPESFIIITCVLFTTYVRYWKRLPDNSLKLKELFLLRSFHMVKVLYLIHFIVPFSSISSDEYSNFF